MDPRKAFTSGSRYVPPVKGAKKKRTTNVVRFKC